MMDGLKEALSYIVGLGKEAQEPQVVEIEGKVYCNKSLSRYGIEDLAEPITANTLSAVVDYIKQRHDELREAMILHIDSPTQVRLYSGLLAEKRREVLFRTNAIVNEFRFDRWYDQERFLIELQANFIETEDLKTIMQVSGNIQAGTTANYGDDGVSQKTTIKTGILNNTEVLVPNPVTLRPYRTFHEITQPESAYVFRIKEDHGTPCFSLIEAEGGLWKNGAMKAIKEYFEFELAEELEKYNITVIA